MTVIKNTVKIPERKVKASFIASLDSDQITQNGGLKRLFVHRCLAINTGESIQVRVKILELDQFWNGQKFVDEGSADDLIAEFTGTLENRDGGYVFSDMKAVREIDWAETPPYPYFYITFAGPNDTVTNAPQVNTSVPIFPVVIGKNDEPYDDGRYEIGFMVEKEDGTFLGGSGNRVSYFYGQNSYGPFLDMFDIRTQLDSVNLLNMTSAEIDYALVSDGKDASGNIIDSTYLETIEPAVSSTTHIYESTISAYNGKKLKAIDKALKRIENLIKSSENPYFQNIQSCNDYYAELDRYKGCVNEYIELLKKTTVYSCGDLETYKSVHIFPLVEKLKKLEDDIHQYLKMTGKPPKAYVDRIEKNIAIITRNKQIDKILSNPTVQIMGLLPGAGVVTGTLKLIKGDIFDGFLDVFGAIVMYGSFLKLSRVARAYRNASKSTTELLYSYRYRKLVSSITKADVIDKITETSLKKSGTFLGNLFDTVGTFKSLKGHVDSLAILHKNRGYIKTLTEKGIAGIKGGIIYDADSFVDFLKDLKQANATAEFFAHLRVLHATVKGTKDAYAVALEAMNDIDKLLGYREIPGVSEFDSEMTGKVSEMFNLMKNNEFRIDDIISRTTVPFPSNAAIVEHFNKDLKQYDMFHVNMNADIRYENSRNEMLLAINDSIDMWNIQLSDLNAFIKAHKEKTLNPNETRMKQVWAVKTKHMNKDFDSSLENIVRNFSEKLKAQIELRESVGQYNSDMTCLDSSVHWVTADIQYTNGIFSSKPFPSGPVIYDIDSDTFRDHAERLVKKYY